MNGSRGAAPITSCSTVTDMNDGYRNDPAINEPGVFGDPATILPIDAVGEMNVISNGEAEYGRNSGAVVNIVTKSGTNQLHGSLLGVQPDQFGWRRANFFNTAGSQDPFHNNQFGGSLGGPIAKKQDLLLRELRRASASRAHRPGRVCVPDPRQIAFDELGGDGVYGCDAGGKSRDQCSFLHGIMAHAEY